MHGLALTIGLEAVQYGARLRAWAGMRFIGLLVIIVLVLAIVYLVKRINSQ